MADITNPQAVRFCNEHVRTVADFYAALYFSAKVIADIWNAQGMAALIPNTSDPVIDGSAQDGRATITGAMVNGMAANLTALISDLEASSKLKLNALLKIAVNPTARQL